MRELVQATGADGREYSVRSINWDLEKVQRYWEQISKFPIFSDDMEKSPQGFLKFVLNAGALWFELYDLLDEKAIGLMYLTDMTQSSTGKLIEATWHAMVWDAKAGLRRPVFRAAIRAIFAQLGFHRLRAEIPLHFGGVIRQAKKIGFKEEGRLRESRQYNGIWFDALLLSVLGKEALEWEA
jgi:RimJ/RimL family protein N-acetyltransferase